MADTYTTSLELRIQTVGGNNNSWGGFLNTDLGNIDTALGGVLSVSLASADVTLSTAQNRNPVIECTGTLTANRNLIVKTYTKHFWIYNNTSGAYTVTVKTAAGTGVEIAQGNWAKVYCDGTNVVEIQEFGALAALDTVDSAQIDSDAITTAKIADSNVTLAKIVDMAANGFLGNDSGGAAAPQELSVTEATALLNAFVADGGSGGTKGLVPAPAAGDAVKALLGDADFHLAEDIDATKSLAADGYLKLPGGVIIQWGDFTSASSGGISSVTMPLAFPSACVFAMASRILVTSGPGNVAILRSKSTTTLSFATANSEVHCWFAVGY